MQYFYHPDHLGSASFVTDREGAVCQHLQYLPFGELFVSQRNCEFDSRYKFTAKELDNETSYTYFGARYYDSDLSVWLSVDPMSDKYPSTSAYMYCSGNPVRLIDPNGMDDFEINSQGEIVNRIENKKADNFYIVDDDGTRIEGKSISFKYGTVESVRSQKAQYSKRNEDGSRESAVTDVDIYKIRGDDNGTQLFEFVADNTGVEWSQIKTGVEGDKGLNFLTTGHIEYTEPGATALINGQLQYGYTIREINHNHPSHSSNYSGKDMKFATQVYELYNNKYPERVNNIIFKIYTGNSNYNTYYENKVK